MSLTDDWKTGKLVQGWYWVKTAHGFTRPVYYLITRLKGKLVKGFAEEPEDRVEQVLARCNYDHFVELTEKVKEFEKEVVKGDTIIGELLNEGTHIKKENRQLRQLLKEVKEKIHDEFINQDIVSIDNFHELLTKINEVLND